jgi:hypothetical protein
VDSSERHHSIVSAYWPFISAQRWAAFFGQQLLLKLAVKREIPANLLKGSGILLRH